MPCHGTPGQPPSMYPKNLGLVRVQTPAMEGPTPMESLG